MISEWFVESANHTSGSFDPEINELELTGFTSIPSKKVNQVLCFVIGLELYISGPSCWFFILKTSADLCWFLQGIILFSECNCTQIKGGSLPICFQTYFAVETQSFNNQKIITKGNVHLLQAVLANFNQSTTIMPHYFGQKPFLIQPCCEWL